MPTLPLYLPNPAHPGASHRVIAPGGYEGWQFDAEDSTQDVQVVATFYDGFVSHPDYLRRYKDYRRRPTRRPPPVPREYPRVEFGVFERGTPVGRFASEDVAVGASADRLDVRAGPAAASAGSDGTIHLTLDDGERSADLRFRPVLRQVPPELPLLPRAAAGFVHRWVLGAPLCEVKGTVRVGPRTIDFRGRGSHDHVYGTAPIVAGLAQWVRGCAFLNDRVYAFHFARTSGRRRVDDAQLIVAGSDGIDELPLDRVNAEYPTYRGVRPPPPSVLRLGSILRLEAPRSFDGLWEEVVAYSAVAEADGARGRALCRVASGLLGR